MRTVPCPTRSSFTMSLRRYLRAVCWTQRGTVAENSRVCGLSPGSSDTNNRQMPLHTPYRHSFVSTYYNDNEQNAQEKKHGCDIRQCWKQDFVIILFHHEPDYLKSSVCICLVYLLIIEIRVWVITTTEQHRNPNNTKKTTSEWVGEWVSEWVSE